MCMPPPKCFLGIIKEDNIAINQQWIYPITTVCGLHIGFFVFVFLLPKWSLAASTLMEMVSGCSLTFNNTQFPKSAKILS